MTYSESLRSNSYNLYEIILIQIGFKVFFLTGEMKSKTQRKKKKENGDKKNTQLNPYREADTFHEIKTVFMNHPHLQK